MFITPADLIGGEAAAAGGGVRVCGDGGVIRLSLGKLLVNLLQVVKRSNTLLIP